jgi:outer membrane protein assembly factor BamE
MAKFLRTGKKMQIKTILVAFISSLLALALTNCSYDFSRRLVQEGNLLPQSKIQRLKLGMTKQDAAILMGTSLLSPTFNNDRWDYAYSLRRGSGQIETRGLSLHFSQDRLVRIERTS